MKHLVAPSFLSADFGRIKEEVEMVNQSEADWLHLDVMDGQFVPNITIGIPMLEAIQEVAEKPMDVHLMVDNPDPLLESFYKAGADHLTVHYEACSHLHRTIQTIRQWGVKAGVALNPHTPVAHLENIIEELDLVIVMSVNPGFGGQSFIPNTLAKLHRLRQFCNQRDVDPYIIVDGGVNLENASAILEAGANVLVAGSTVFKSDNPSQTIRELKNLRPKRVKEV